jgi:EmrB/QacA subfamily drug resistance transporter
MQTQNNAIAKPVVRTAQEEEFKELYLRNGKKANPWLVLVSLILGLFMALLDATIVNIALTAISTELNTELSTATWVLNSYSLVFAVLLVTVGRLADQFGRKRIFMTGMVLFSLGSLLCATAPNIETLIGFRALQAIGASALNPISLAIITMVFPPKRRGAAIGIWGALTGIAMAMGPIVGGFLVENFDWRSIFFVNLPFCALGLFMVWQFVPETRDPAAPRSIDWLGTLLLTVSLFCLVLAIMKGNEWGWFSAGILLLFAGFAVALVLFVLAETYQKHPIIEFKLFKIRSFITSNLAMFTFGMGIQAAMLILVIYFIMSRGYTQLEAAYALLPMPVAGFFMSGMFGMFSRKMDLRWAGIAALLLSGGGLVSLSFLDYRASYLDIAIRGVLIGTGLGLSFMTFSNIVLSEVPFIKMGVASGVFNTFRQIGFALGVAILVSFFSGQLTDRMQTASNNAISLVRNEASIPAPVKEMITEQFKKMSGQADMNSGSSMSQFNLSDMVSKMPGGEALKPQLDALNEKIGLEFKKAIADSFSITWLLGGIIILLGIIPAAFTRHVHPKQ